MRARKSNITGGKDFGIVGRVKIGELGNNNFPTSLDYFKFQSSNPINFKIAEAAYPNDKETKRNWLLVTFSSDSVDNCQNHFELRDAGGKLFARTDMSTKLEISLSPDWNGWISKYSSMMKSPPDIENDSFIKLYAEDFGEGKIAPSLEVFAGTIRDGLYNKALKEKKRGAAQIKWKEIIRIKFVLCNTPILGRWILESGGARTSIQNILDAYDAVMEAKGTVVGTYFMLQVDKVKSNRAGISRNYPILSLVAIRTPEDMADNRLLLQTVTETRPMLGEAKEGPKEGEIKVVNNNQPPPPPKYENSAPVIEEEQEVDDSIEQIFEDDEEEPEKELSEEELEGLRNDNFWD